MWGVSFDIFFQRFSLGNEADADADLVTEMLRPYTVERCGDGVAVLEFADGRADIYGVDDLTSGFMINHASGTDIWRLMAALAKGADLTIMPVGCATVVTSTEAISQLPSDLAVDAVVVTSGTELLGVISSAIG